MHHKKPSLQEECGEDVEVIIGTIGMWFDWTHPKDDKNDYLVGNGSDGLHPFLYWCCS